MPRARPTLSRLAAALAVAVLGACGGGGGSGSGNTITLRYQTPLTGTQRAAFEDARARLEKIITGGLGGVSLGAGLSCDTGNGSTTINGTVNGLLILVSVSDLGTSGIIAQSGPCIVRKSSGLPVVATMTLNSNPAVNPGNVLGAVVQHEMFHALGFGTIWADKAFLSGAGSADPTFTGPLALAAAKAANGAPTSWTSVPVENTGGSGTRDAHWRESVFGTELMTGFISAGLNPLSATTIESMADLGYTVDDTQADVFTIPFPGAAVLEGGAGARLDMGDDIVHVPPVVVSD